MAISQNFPEEKPTLNLNFAGSRVLDPRITLSRSSVGTYMDDNGLLKTAAADEPRFDHDDVTGESLGLLIEESRTNLIPYSVVNTTNWTSSGQTPVSLSLNALGVFPGVRAISNGQVWHGLYIENISLTSGTTYTATWYFRKGDINPSNKFRAIVRDVSAARVTTFEKSSASTDYGDISSYSFNENTNATTNFEYLSVDTLADGLTYKLCIRFDAAASSDYRFMFQTNSATVGETIIALGLQVEEGEFPTSYIPTSGSTVTRDPDNVSMTGTNFSNITTGISKIVVGAPSEGVGGAVYVYDLDGSNEVKITASDAASSDDFGDEAVAIGHNKVVVGAPAKSGGGAVYVYDLDGTNEVKITASDGISGDRFGRSVAVGNNKIVVGADLDDDTPSNSGSVYVYDLDGSNEVKITASDAAGSDNFGRHVAIGNNKIVVGAYGNDDDGSRSGSAYIYDLDGTNEVKITASDGAAGDWFGFPVAIGNDKVVVGAHQDSNNGNGAVYVYDLDGTNEVKITASDGASDDFFGMAVAVGNNKIVVGAYGDDDNGSNSGSAYIYDLDGTNEVKITASDGATSDIFGSYKVSIGANKIIIGAPFDDDNGSASGSAYIYDLDGTNEVKITASDGASGDQFGTGVFIGEGSEIPNWYNQDEGTVYVSQKLRAVQDTARNNLVYLINGGNQNDYYYNTKIGGNNIFVFGDGGTIYRSFGQGGVNSIDSKTVFAYDVSGDDFKAYYNGIEATNETNNNTPSATSHTQLELGATATAKYCGHIQQFVYYSKRLSNAQLQNLTK